MSSLITSPLLKTYTLEEFWQLPDTSDGTKLELIAGVLYMSPPPDYKHDNAVKRLNRKLSVHLETINDRGGLYVPRAAIWTGKDTYLEPDLFYISAELEATLEPDHRNRANLVVEVISPGSAIYDRNTKAETYGALGIDELWLIDDKNESVEVRYQAGNGFDSGTVFQKGEQIISRIFPDLNLLVGDLFND